MGSEGGRKLIVEVCNAINLMPKDGHGFASAYVVVEYGEQRKRTATVSRDLNPQWNQQLDFDVHGDVKELEITVFNEKKAMAAAGARRGSSFLGKVRIGASAFAKAGEELMVYYPLEKRSVFSTVKGDIGLKIWYADAPPAPEKAKKEDANKAAEDEKKEGVEEKKEEKEEEKKEKSAEKAKGEEKKLKEDRKTEAPPAMVVVTASPGKELRNHHGYAARDLEASDSVAGDSAGAGAGNYDLVDHVFYLFVRMLKAKRHGKSTAGSTLFGNLAVGNHAVRTRAANAGGEWEQVFAFNRTNLAATALEVSVHEQVKTVKKKEKPPAPEEAKADAAPAAAEDAVVVTEDCLGVITFDLQEIPKRSLPDSPLAPQWYTLDGAAGCDVMLAVWIGTQADEAFQEAWQSDSGGLIPHTRCKAYLSPKLWYLRLTVIQAQDVHLAPLPPETKAARPPLPELCVKAQLGSQMFKTGRAAVANPHWNEDLVFVAAEPFDPFMTVLLEDATSGQVLGQTAVPLATVRRRSSERVESPARWLDMASDDPARPYAGRVHVRVCLEGGYHVLDEAASLASDVRAASKHLSKPSVGMLEVGVRGASNLVPMKIAKDGAGGSTDAYVVLKYGPKWARTRTILNQFNPRWNEQYAWDVFDPCTVLTVAVFDNVRFKSDDGKAAAKDARIGKVRIRLSMLDTNRVYVTSFPLTAVLPVGVRRMGELELAVRFTCPSWLTLIQSYAAPMLPRMHYVLPLGPQKQDVLRQTAMRTVSARLARSEPPLGPEVVHYMLDNDNLSWSIRRSKANWFRAVHCLSWLASLSRWIHRVRSWSHPPTTILAQGLLMALIAFPGMLLPSLCLYLFVVLLWRYRRRQGGPSGIDARASQLDSVTADELDEEFDIIPSSRPADVVRARYDRLRAVAGRAQVLLGDFAAQGERVEALLAWRDPRATGIFTVLCFLAALVLYVVPLKVLLVLMVMYQLRHPRFRGDMPSTAFNFFRRLPSRSDRIL